MLRYCEPLSAPCLSIVVGLCVLRWILSKVLEGDLVRFVSYLHHFRMTCSATANLAIGRVNGSSTL